MTSLIKNRFTALRHVTIDNPLFLYRLQRLSAYTWLNLATLLLLLSMVYFTAARVAHYWEIKQMNTAYAAAMPAGEIVFDSLKYRYGAMSFKSFSRFSEDALFFGQLAGIALLFLLLLLGLGRRLLWWDKLRWDHPDSPHIRLLPVSRSQAQFALVDLNFFAMSLCILFAALLLFLPYLKLEAPFSIYEAFFAAAGIWVFIFAVYRTLQLQKLFGWKVFRNPMLRCWIGFFFLWLAFRGLSKYLLLLSYEGSTADYSSIVFFSFICVASPVLLVSCWMFKHRLLEHPPPE